MTNRFSVVKRIYFFILFFIKAKGRHRLHSPFVYALYERCIHKKITKTDLTYAKWLNSLKNNETSLILENGRKTRINSLYKRSASDKRFRHFLSSLCEFLCVKVVIETGTCLGTTSTLLASNPPFPKVHTIEKEDALVGFLKSNMPIQFKNNVHIHKGNVHEKLNELSKKIPAQLYFLDADHRYESIMDQIRIARSSSQTICIVIHDIYWSQGMKKAWTEIIKDEKILLTIDMFHAGLLFFNQNREKQHFHLAFW